MFYSKESAGFFELMSKRTASVARQHGLNVETREIEGDHNSHVPCAITNSILFFQNHRGRNSAMGGRDLTAPETVELDLGAEQSLKLVRIEPVPEFTG